ncbi:annexin, partial [Kipferlia bialata]
AELVRKACKGMGTNEQCLIDIIFCRSNDEIKAIAAAYEKTFFRNMKEDILDEFSGKMKRVFIAGLSMGRESGPADPSRIDSDVQALRKATKGMGTDEAVVYSILFSRSHLHLRAVFAAFAQAYGKGIRDIMKSEFSGKIEDAILCVVDWVNSPATAAAVIIHRSIKGLGTDDKRLIACLATCYDTCGGYGRVAAAYDLKYGPGKCAKDIKGDLSGNYEKLALALLRIE